MMSSKRWVQTALAVGAGAIGYSGHDGWGWFLFIILLLE